MIKLKQLHPNNGQIKGVPSNPRIITEKEFKELKKSLKDFTKMLGLRPIIVDENWDILGGNMRYQALCKLGEEGATTEIRNKENVVESYYKFDDEIPEEWVKQVQNLSPEEKMEFVIKDNQERGEWDYEKLDTEWEEKTSGTEWELPKDNRWKPEMDEKPAFQFGEGEPTDAERGSAGKEGEDEDEPFNLPDELDGVDMEPEGLENIEGDDDTAYEYLIIGYEEGEEEVVSELLGIPYISKIVYEFDEIKK